MNGFRLICSHVIQLYALRGLKRGSSSSINHHHQATSNGKTPPSSSSLATATSADPMGNNYRPVQPTHHRAVRTNIDFTSPSSPSSPTSFQVCSSSFDSIHDPVSLFCTPFSQHLPLFFSTTWNQSDFLPLLISPLSSNENTVNRKKGTRKK